jgi:hypothetical protein
MTTPREALRREYAIRNLTTDSMVLPGGELAAWIPGPVMQNGTQRSYDLLSRGPALQYPIQSRRSAPIGKEHSHQCCLCRVARRASLAATRRKSYDPNRRCKPYQSEFETVNTNKQYGRRFALGFVTGGGSQTLQRRLGSAGSLYL